MTISSSPSILITELLVVFPPAPVSLKEWFLDIGAGIPALYVLEGGVHLGGYLIKLLATIPGMHRRLEAEAEELFIVGKVAGGF